MYFIKKKKEGVRRINRFDFVFYLARYLTQGLAALINDFHFARYNYRLKPAYKVVVRKPSFSRNQLKRPKTQFYTLCFLSLILQVRP